MNDAYLAVRFQLTNLLTPSSKKERGDQLIEVLGLIIIGLIVLVAFRTQITDWVGNILTQIKSYFTDLFAANPLTGDYSP